MSNSNSSEGTAKSANSSAGFIRDSAWQFVGVIVAIISICLATFSAYDIFYRGRDIKALEVNILANSSLLTINRGEYTNHVQVYYKEEFASNLTFIDISFKNTGNQTIRPEDYVRSITLIFPSGSKVLETRLLGSNPANIGLISQIDPSNLNTVHLSPILLNKNDEVRLSFLIVNMPPTVLSLPFDLDARIAGIEEVKILNSTGTTTIQKTRNNYVVSMSVWTLLMLLGFVFVTGIFFTMRAFRPKYRYL